LGFELRTLTLTRQALYCLSHSATSHPSVSLSHSYIQMQCILILFSNMIILFLVFREIAILLSAVALIYIPTNIPFSLYHHQHLLLFVFLMIAIMTVVRLNLNDVLICISFITKDVEHLHVFIGNVYFLF
jgi:hypothetical protein